MKRVRQRKIIEIVENNEIETQEDLAELLQKEGFFATQATISRDIRELKLSKVSNKEGKQRYVVLKHEENYLGDKYNRVLKEGFVSMDQAQNILVVKTVSGMAMAVAAAIDGLKYPEIVGSIAGDDTIMVAVRSTEETTALIQKIREVLDT